MQEEEEEALHTYDLAKQILMTVKSSCSVADFESVGIKNFVKPGRFNQL
jgi:hypothetical protein